MFRKGRHSMKLRSKCATATAITAVVLAASACPAIAASADDVGVLDNKSVETRGGKMTFIDDGDVFKICDTNADGKGVYGALFYAPYWDPNDHDRVMTISDGGDAGCDKKGHNIGNSGIFYMKICWGSYPEGIDPDNGCDVSGGFNE
jgi:hypothetical protein